MRPSSQLGCHRRQTTWHHNAVVALVFTVASLLQCNSLHGVRNIVTLPCPWSPLARYCPLPPPPVSLVLYHSLLTSPLPTTKAWAPPSYIVCMNLSACWRPRYQPSTSRHPPLSMWVDLSSRRQNNKLPKITAADQGKSDHAKTVTVSGQATHALSCVLSSWVF